MPAAAALRAGGGQPGLLLLPPELLRHCPQLVHHLLLAGLGHVAGLGGQGSHEAGRTGRVGQRLPGQLVEAAQHGQAQIYRGKVGLEHVVRAPVELPQRVVGVAPDAEHQQQHGHEAEVNFGFEVHRLGFFRMS